MSNPRLEANDLVMEAVIASYRLTGHKEQADFCEKQYEKDRAIIEAEELTKENK